MAVHTETNSASDPVTAARQHWMSVLARAAPEPLARAVAELAELPPYTFLRRPETGLVMLRGRMGGKGDRFNVGEVSVTRCSIRLADGTVGHAYVMGRDARHGELAALCDALMQRPESADEVRSKVVEPLAAEFATRRQQTAAKVAATKVDFFTMVRGDD